MRKILFQLTAVLIVSCAWAQGVITTVAGTSRQFRHDGAPALTAKLGAIGGLAVDAAGNAYLSCTPFDLVVKVSTDGSVSVFAGNGIQGFSGDGGPARSASLANPQGLAIDAAGNLYIADTNNGRIRRVTPDGIITTVAGGGSTTGDGGPATAASISPSRLTFDAAGNLYLQNDRVIRKIDSSGIITTVAGNGLLGYSGDGGPAINASLSITDLVAAAGNIYISENANSRIRKIDPEGIITTIAGTGILGFSGDGGPAVNATLSTVAGLALDGSGNLLVADHGNSRIRRIDAAGVITTVAGNGTAGFPGEGGPGLQVRIMPNWLAFRSGNLFIADATARLNQMDANGIARTIAGSGLSNFFGDGGPAENASLSTGVTSIAADASGALYIADPGNYRVRKLSLDGILTTVAGNGAELISAATSGVATEVSIGTPHGVAVDGSGNLYISILATILRVDRSGMVSRFAGTGRRASTGDGGLATAADLDLTNGNGGISFDPAGNLYFAEVLSNRVRRVTPSGIITTIAGNGTRGFSGDGGPATAATLDRPASVVADGAGNIYFGDSNETRVRQIRPDGTIMTIAGDGIGGGTGDGGSAVNGRVQVRGLLLDPAGNLYMVGVPLGSRVRKIGTDGVITTVAGFSTHGFAGDGGLATRAALDFPYGLAMDPAGNLYIADSNNERIRKILASPPPFSVSTAPLEFAAPAGTPTVAPQRLTITSPITGLAWTAAKVTQSCSNWLTTSATSGKMPAVLEVQVNVAALQPGTCRGTVTVTSSLSSTPPQVIAVTLTVQPSVLAKLMAESAGLAFQTHIDSGSPAPRSLVISNGGIGTLLWTAQTSTTSGGNWLTVSAASGSVTPATPATIQVRAALGTLAPGTYSGSIRVSSSTTNQTETLPVTFTIAQAPQTILVSQDALTFTGVEGGTSVPSQTIGILNIGAGTMPWTLQAAPLGGGNWLSVSPRASSSIANSLTVPMVEVRVNAAGLRAGQYTGYIQINATGANNSPRTVMVYFTVLPSGSNPGVLVRPTGLIFVRQQGTSSPSSQLVRLSTAGAGTLLTRVNPGTFSGVEWLDAAPRVQSLSASAPPTFTVQPALGDLAPGQYFGALTLLFDDNTSQTVNVLFVVTPAIRTQRFGGNEADGCVAQQLFVVSRSLTGSFTTPAGLPAQIQVQVKDDCDAPVPGASVLATFSNGDPPLALSTLGNGLYEGAWLPLRTGPVSITVRSERTGLSAAQARVDGQVGTAPPNLAAVNPGGIVNAASFARGEALAPGSIISVFGTNLANGQAGASSLPLGTQLTGATLSVAGVDSPSFFSSPGQINAQLPVSLVANTRPQAVVRVQAASGTETITLPETITVTEARAGIFAINQQGTGQGAILNQDSTLNSATVAAARGSTVQVFATGLGATQPPVTSGQASPAQPLANVVVPVTARVGGLAAPVSFAGLAPGFVGLYQVNVVIPAGVTPGSAVALTLIQNGVSSNAVTLAIR